MTVTGNQQRIHGSLISSLFHILKTSNPIHHYDDPIHNAQNAALTWLTTFSIGYHYSSNSVIANESMQFTYRKRQANIYICSVLDSQWYGYASNTNHYTSPIIISYDNAWQCVNVDRSDSYPINVREQTVDGLVRCTIIDQKTNELVYHNYSGGDSPYCTTEEVCGWAHGFRDIGQYMILNHVYVVTLWINYHFYAHQFTSTEDIWVLQSIPEIII